MAPRHELLHMVYSRRFPLPSSGAAIETVATALVSEQAVIHVVEWWGYGVSVILLPPINHVSDGDLNFIGKGKFVWRRGTSTVRIGISSGNVIHI